MGARCSVCERKDQKYVHVQWCTECQKSLCSTCRRRHQQNNHTKDHDTMSYSDYVQLPPLIKNQNQTCPEHREKLLYLCREHDQLICNKCLKETHNQCEETPVLKDIVRIVKTSYAFDNVTCEMEDTSEILQNGIRELQKNLDEIQNQRKEMEQKVGDTMDRIMTELQKIKNDMLSDINAEMQKNEKNVVETMIKLQTMEKELREIINQKQSITLHATNLQTYFGIKEMENLVWRTTKRMQEISEEGAIENIGLEQPKNIERLLNDLKSFVEIKVVKTATDLSMETSKPMEAQSKISDLPRDIKLLQKVDLKGFHYGCCTLPNGMLVVTDFENKKLKRINPDGTIKSTLMIADSPVDVTAVDENCVAVSHEATISKMDVRRKKFIRSWTTPGKVTGISYTDGHIIFCVYMTGLKRLNIHTGTIDNVINDTDVKFYSRIVTGNDRICYTCPNIHTVTVLNLQHNVIFKYKDADRLKYPWGVTLDNYNNVYVAGGHSDNVLVISPDGQTVHQLLSKDDGLCEPTGILYDSHAKQLTVIAPGTFRKYSLE